MDKLSNRVMALEGPDREVDCLIAVAVGWFVSEPNKGWPERMDYIDIRGGTKSYPGGGFDQLVPKFSASLDAAMSLLPTFETEDGLKQADFILECVNGWLTIGCRVGHNNPDENCWGATPALALCAAALKARGL